MPRLPFPRDRRAILASVHFVLQLVLVAAPLTLVAAAANATPPVARIVATTPTQGQAPFAVHVHGLTSTLNIGDETTARYEWTFGDPSGSYNTLVGWNAAHI